MGAAANQNSGNGSAHHLANGDAGANNTKLNETMLTTKTAGQGGNFAETQIVRKVNRGSQQIEYQTEMLMADTGGRHDLMASPAPEDNADDLDQINGGAAELQIGTSSQMNLQMDSGSQFRGHRKFATMEVGENSGQAESRVTHEEVVESGQLVESGHEDGALLISQQRSSKASHQQPTSARKPDVVSAGHEDFRAYYDMQPDEIQRLTEKSPPTQDGVPPDKQTTAIPPNAQHSSEQSKSSVGAHARANSQVKAGNSRVTDGKMKSLSGTPGDPNQPNRTQEAADSTHSRGQRIVRDVDDDAINK